MSTDYTQHLCQDRRKTFCKGKSRPHAAGLRYSDYQRSLMFCSEGHIDTGSPQEEISSVPPSLPLVSLHYIILNNIPLGRCMGETLLLSDPAMETPCSVTLGPCAPAAWNTAPFCPYPRIPLFLAQPLWSGGKRLCHTAADMLGA